MLFTGTSDEYLLLTSITTTNASLIKDTVKDGLTMLWNVKGTLRLQVDDMPCILQENQILTLTEFHKVEVVAVEEARLVRFNRAFYCILDHDSEVSCKGILFFGASSVPVIDVPLEEQEKFEILWKMFSIEMVSRDNLQIEMLQMMLKRLLILCTRLYREQHHVDTMKTSQLDIVREFNFLVERHFKTKHTVADYADLLHKSPKTLANLFSRYNQKKPLQIVQERILLEARRLLHYSNLSIKEIAYELGFEDIQSFSRFFRNKEGIAPSDYRDQIKNIESGSIANSLGNPA